MKNTLGYKLRSNQNGIRKQPMSKNDKIGTEEEIFSVHCVQDIQRDGRKKSEAFQETSVDCSNSSKV